MSGDNKTLLQIDGIYPPPSPEVICRSELAIRVRWVREWRPLTEKLAKGNALVDLSRAARWRCRGLNDQMARNAA